MKAVFAAVFCATLVACSNSPAASSKSSSSGSSASPSTGSASGATNSVAAGSNGSSSTATAASSGPSTAGSTGASGSTQTGSTTTTANSSGRGATLTGGTVTGGTVTGGTVTAGSVTGGTVTGGTVTGGTLGTNTSGSGSTSGGLSCNPPMGFQGNQDGVGAYCDANTACPNGLTCAGNLDASFPFCTKLTCSTDADCGSGACCASVLGMSACLPQGCGFCPAGSASTTTTGSTGGSAANTTATNGASGSTGNNTAGSTGGSTGGSTTGSTTGGTDGGLSCDPPVGFQGNAQGVGAYCDSSHACPSGLQCAGQLNPSTPFCTVLSCASDSVCGEGACCTSDRGFMFCAPSGCGLCPAGTTSTTGGSSGGSTTGSTGATGGGIPEFDAGTGAITGLPTKQWVWVDFDDAFCRDGSKTGLAINLNPKSTDVMIFLNGGGACFDPITCADNPASAGPADFVNQAGNVTDGGQAPGIFDRNDTENPVADWNMVFIPYCTGDVHAGNAPDGGVAGVGPQMFVGYENIAAYLKRLVPTFKKATQVLFTGASAGGFGASANYTQVARAFGKIPVNMIDDSGPFMRDPYLASCLQTQVDGLWGLSSTLLADCGSACPDPTNYFLDYSKFVVSSYPNQTFGLMDSTDDGTITQFFGFGLNNCVNSGVPPALSAAQFDAGLMDIRNQLSSDTNFGSFYFAGTDHTTLGTAGTFDTRSAPLPDGGTITLPNWISDQIAGVAQNVGP